VTALSSPCKIRSYSPEHHQDSGLVKADQSRWPPFCVLRL
jgi:hypothetical protein